MVPVMDNPPEAIASLLFFLEDPAFFFGQPFGLLPCTYLSNALGWVTERRVISVDQRQRYKGHYFPVKIMLMKHVTKHAFNHIPDSSLGIGHANINRHLGNIIQGFACIIPEKDITNLRSVAWE
jgi:hypothetical protein